jgi:formylmethanofuran dehydrogenase subunit E
MGGIAKRVFNQDPDQSPTFRVTAKVPLVIPFSCTIDGIQATTHCTLGNQRLRVENAQRRIFASFRAENSGEVVRVSVNPRIIRELMRKMSAGVDNSELAGEITVMSETQLFTIEKE